MPDPTPLDAVLLDVIACPTCHGSLVPAPDSASLTCATCQVRYPVEDGIPVLLVDEALPLEDQGAVPSVVGETDDDERT